MNFLSLFNRKSEIDRLQQQINVLANRQTVTTLNLGNVVFTDYDMPALIDLYNNNADVKGILDTITVPASNIDFELSQVNTKDGSKTPLPYNHADQIIFRNLISNPNQFEDKIQFLKTNYDFFNVLGNDAIYIKRSLLTSLKDAKLYTLPFQNLDVVLKDNTYKSEFWENEILGYRLNLGSNFDFTDVNNVIHWRESNLNYSGGQFAFGSSKFKTASKNIEVLNELLKYYLSNAKHKGARIIISGLVGYNGVPASPEEIDRTQAIYKEKYGTGDTQSDTMFVSSNVQKTDLDSKFNPVSNIPLDDNIKKTLARLLNIPLPLVSTDASSYNNLATAKRSLMVDTILPLVNGFANTLTNKLYKGTNYVISPILRNIEELKDDYKVNSEIYGKAYTENAITLNEYRQKIGLSELQNGNVFFKDLNIQKNEANSQQR